MVEKQLNRLFPLFSTHLGFRALTGSLIFPLKYLQVRIRLRNLCLSHRKDSYVFHNGENIGPNIGGPGIMSQVYLTSFVIYCRNVERWMAYMAKFSERKITGKVFVQKVWGPTIGTYLE